MKFSVDFQFLNIFTIICKILLIIGYLMLQVVIIFNGVNNFSVKSKFLARKG